MKWNIFTNTPDTQLEGQITSVLDEMAAVGVSSPEYLVYIGYLERLNGIKVKKTQNPVSRDMMAMVIGNVMISLIVVAAEEKHVLNSKALGQLMKSKLNA